MDILALDFDGVICDSAGETGTSGWKAACRLWPDEFRGDAPTAIIEAFRKVRPVLETGFESILLISMLKNGTTVDEICANYHELRDALLAEIGMERDDLILAFGKTRDDWMRDDINSWLAVHRFYPGVVDAINQSAIPSYIITTKERRFAVALIRHAGLMVDDKRVYGLESGKKMGVLTEIHRENPGASIHFVEDRLKTLVRVQSEANEWLKLHFAPWGYVTDSERMIAESSAGINPIEQADFPQFAQKPALFTVANSD